MRIALPAALALAASLAGCVKEKTFPIQLRSDLMRAEVAPYGVRGERRILGQAFLRQNGGGIVTCAGETVTLLPAVTVVEEAVKIWKAGDEIYTVNLENANVTNAVRWIECDMDGNFVFTELPPLTYWVMVPVKWKVLDEDNGAMLAEKVSLGGGSQDRVIIDDEDKLPAAKPWQLTPHL